MNMLVPLPQAKPQTLVSPVTDACRMYNVMHGNVIIIMQLCFLYNDFLCMVYICMYMFGQV